MAGVSMAAHAADRNVSSRLSHSPMRFQLATFRPTLFKSLILKTEISNPLGQVEPLIFPRVLKQSRVADVLVRSSSDQAPLGALEGGSPDRPRIA
jgi:hypothetical protein